MMRLSLEEFMIWLQIHAETRKLEGKLDALLNLQFSARNDAIVIRGIHDVATDTSAETRKLEGKLDALVNFVTQLATNQKSASVARQFSARNDAIVIRGVHDVATDTSAKTRKLEGKLDAHVNLVTQLATNQKPGSVARVCSIRSSNDHHTSVCPSSQQSGVDEHLEAYKAGRQARCSCELGDSASCESNQKPASIARLCGIRSSNNHHTSVCPSSQQSGVDDHPEDYAANTYSRPPQQ
ncbi:hypothetical protein Fmac_032911 [Flemingia macrophylla]|uniref:Uncharacterized protein n=1 Tax=Flemingia macrophylla TaxID=520843 RepID=A0ABD1L699_9FABA